MHARNPRRGLTLVGVVLALACGASTALADGDSARRLRLQDPRGDVASGALDVLSLTVVRRDGLIVARFRLAKRPGDHAIYSVWLRKGGRVAQLGAKRTPGAGKLFVFRPDYTQVPATGWMSGRVVTISAPLSRIGLGGGTYRVFATAQATNVRTGRRVQLDRVPNGDQKTVAFP
jgi:hypothetical protein